MILELWYNSITNQGPKTDAPWGNYWISEEEKQKYYDQGWKRVSVDFIPPIVLTIQQKIDALNAEYDLQRTELKDAIVSADALGDTERVTALKAEYITLWNEFNAKMEEIENG